MAVPVRLALLFAALAAALPAAAQKSGPADPTAPVRPVQTTGEVSREAPVNGVLTLFGNQRCPTDSSGNEVVVCVRQGASEQFRIPKGLREFKVTAENQSWASQQVATLDTGASGTGSCTAIGAGGGVGCTMQQTRLAKKEAQDRAKAATPDLTGY